MVASQLFYHIIWPHVISPSELIASNEERLRGYHEVSNKTVVFDKDQYISAKDRMRGASEDVLGYDLSTASPK